MLLSQHWDLLAITIFCAVLALRRSKLGASLFLIMLGLVIHVSPLVHSEQIWQSNLWDLLSALLMLVGSVMGLVILNTRRTDAKPK